MNFKNLALGYVATAPSPATTGTSLVLGSGEGARFPQPSTDGNFYVTAMPPGENPNVSNSEILQVTARSTNTLTIVREQGDTTAKKIEAGWIILQSIYKENILDEDTMASNSATALATQQSIKAYVDNSPTDSIFRQAIINGNFDVSQRGTTFVAGANNDDTYTLDHWNLISDGNDVFDVSRVAITDLPGSNYAIKLDVETAKRGGIVQFLEAKDAQKFKGKTVSISFAVKSANISALRATVLSWAGTADSVTSDVVGTWGATPTWATNWADNATPADLTVASSWTTVKVEGIVLDESTVNNLALVIWTPNEETIGDIVYITQVQMNEGSVALPFMPKSLNEEERDCRRFYRLGMLLGVAQTTDWLSTSVDFATNPARVTPTTSNFKIYTTRANAVAEIAQQSLTRPGVGDTDISPTALQTDIGMGISAVQMTGTPLTADKAYSGWYVLNQEL
jgi:hypothetical protein